MKIGLTTWHEGPNPGTFFQCYGLYSYLKSRGHEVSVIDYVHQKEDFLKKGIYYHMSQLFPLIKRKIATKEQHKQDLINMLPFRSEIEQRDERVKEFWGRMEYTNPITSSAEFNGLNDKFDAFVVGSDQVWNATMLNRRYLLDYVNDDKLKVAFGPSVGVGTVLPYQRKMYKKYVSRFDKVAVREKVLCDILNEEIPGIHTEHLLDPSMLYPREEYLKMAKLPDGVVPGSYALCYFAPNERREEEMIRQYAKERGLKIIVMPMFGYSWTMNCDLRYCADPSEFVGLIANAAAIFTSSFHCTIFSIMLHKDLFVLQRLSKSKSANISVRYSEQLDTYNIMRRLIPYGGTLTDEALAPIDYEMVEKIFQTRLEDSKRFLDKIFGR